MPLVNLLNRDVCRECPHSSIVTTALENGQVLHQNKCTRADCDNYRTATLLPLPLPRNQYWENASRWLNLPMEPEVRSTGNARIYPHP